MTINELKCDGCPALPLRTKDQLQKIKQWEKLREKAIAKIDNIRLFILCESIPAKRFFYDLDAVYENKGLRFNIKEELELESEKDVLKYFDKNGIVLADCAYCPLHKEQLSNKDRRHAASICLKNHTSKILKLSTKVPIVTIFPTRRGYLKTDFPEIESRKVRNFSFNDLRGLKQSIEELIK